MARRLRNVISSDSDSESGNERNDNSNILYTSDDDVPLFDRWQSLNSQRKLQVPTSAINFEPKILHYTDLGKGVLQESGLSEESCPLSIFEFFFNKGVIELIVNETNKYIKKQDLSSSRYVTSEDIYSFLSIIIYMSIVHLPTLSLYWNTDSMYNFEFVRRIMSRPKFLHVLRFLRFSSTDESNDATNPAHKIQPVIDILLDRFQKAYRPRQHVAVDESLLLLKGKLSFKQYIPSKRARFCLKSFILAEFETGYVYNLKLYTGQQLHKQKSASLGIYGSIVMDLSKNLLNEGRIIYLDNWYMSPTLYEELYKHDTHPCGTGQLGRKDYNMHMGGVHHSDQSLRGYESFRKTLKWYKRYFFYLLDITIYNSLVIWNCCHANRNSFRKMKEDIITGLLRKYHNPNKNFYYKGKKCSFHVLRFQSRCFPHKIPPSNSKCHPTKRCVLCKTKNLRKETSYYCKNCDAALCVTPCFELYHVQEK